MSSKYPDGGGQASTESPEATEPRVLVVDDDTDLAETFRLWLTSEFDVETAYGGEEALEKLDDDIDVVLLDRRMPEMSGGDVLDEIRDRGLDCRVSMVTAVEPSEDIVEMEFDEYLVKPVERDGVIDVVEELHARLSYDEDLQEYYAVSAKVGALESQLTPTEQSQSDALAELRERLEELETATRDGFEDVDGMESAFREI
ncbi:response regulator transcription factor [Halocalculus aciditolerans]|uniref:DNA-binding protein n=1 Tax=Halocalculus aciditolerans TaxID=1383812 RepID=A0A830FC80_9EURY|nr:response regulator [Halocalculus aciditolerans]GGL61066.1 DNA-binding protein [Halocalculus aciditolerans]